MSGELILININKLDYINVYDHHAKINPISNFENLILKISGIEKKKIDSQKIIYPL
jgi:hypothetical protein